MIWNTYKVPKTAGGGGGGGGKKKTGGAVDNGTLALICLFNKTLIISFAVVSCLHTLKQHFLRQPGPGNTNWRTMYGWATRWRKSIIIDWSTNWRWKLQFPILGPAKSGLELSVCNNFFQEWYLELTFDIELAEPSCFGPSISIFRLAIYSYSKPCKK